MARGPISEAFAETMLTAAARVLVLKVLVPVLLLWRRIGARGLDILTVVVILVARPVEVKAGAEAETVAVVTTVCFLMSPPSLNVDVVSLGPWVR